MPLVMADEAPRNLRIRLSDGSEFEAAGPDEFIREYLKYFSEKAAPPSREMPRRQTTNNEEDLHEPRIDWDAIIEIDGKDVLLRAKLGHAGSEKEACLILIAASQKILNTPKPSAIELARWLRKSGYPILRIDRILQAEASQGEILASGSRRSRRYELSPQGKIKAFLAAETLTKAITGSPSL